MGSDNRCFPCQISDIISFAGRVAPSALGPIQHEVGYVIFCQGKFMELTGGVRNLEAAKEAIKNRVDAERRSGKRIEVGVQNWLVDVNEVIERANQLLEDPRRHEVGFSRWWSFPNLILRYQLGKRATEIANEVAGLDGRRNFYQVGYLPALNEFATSSATQGGEKLETRESFKDEILMALRDPKAHKIGVYGLGGVGKTTLVKEIAEIAKQQKMFDVVVIALVSKTPDIKAIQGVIADRLGLRFEEETTAGRAYRLNKRLEDEKNVLVILDDTWPTFELEKVGIPLISSKSGNKPSGNEPSGDEPSGDKPSGCKLLLASRSQDVLLKFDVQKEFTFRLELLSEKETWILFQSMAGNVVNDISLHVVATEISQKCAGLPLLIGTVATGLKSKNIHVWKDALRQLLSVGHAEMDDITHSALELSYNWLASDEIKALFLLSAVLEDSNVDYLLNVAMGLDIFKNINTVDNARNRLLSIIESLKASCLLLEGNTIRHIQMHDLVRDVAISIARRDKHVCVVKPKAELGKCLTGDFLKWCSQIILSQCQIHELPQRLDCPNVKLFLLHSVDRSLEIPNTFFEGMGSLKVLDLTCLNLSSLPTSFLFLTGLQTLCLDQCVLENIDIIGDLKALEILSFWKSVMTRLPSRIKELTNLRMLDLSNSGIEVIPPNIISSLIKLEELYLGNTSIKWGDESSANKNENASLSELHQLCNLTALEIQTNDAFILPKDFKLIFENLQRYKIAIGDVWEWSDIKGATLKTLMLKISTNIHVEHEIKALIKGVENLYLDEVHDIQNVLYQMNGEGFPLLKHLHIQNNAKLKHIVDTMEGNRVDVSFPNLKTLFIKNLEKLEQICHGSLALTSFGMLSVIKVKNCVQLKYLLSLSMVKGLFNLSEIDVCLCNSMKNILLGDCDASVEKDILAAEKIEFRSMYSLTIQHLQTLDNFFSYESTSSITEQNYHGLQQPCISTPFFSAQVAFPNLVTLKLSSLNFNKIWDENHHSMYNLTILIVENCGGLKYLFSSSMVDCFVNLRWLEISKCNLMNEIISPEKRNDGTISSKEVSFPKLEMIILKDMENLQTVWHCQFDTVKTLEVQNCEKIVVVFPSSMQKTYHNLEVLKVKGCALVEEIFELTSSGNSSIEGTTHLKVITLDGLPKLKNIWSRDPQGNPSFHNLQNVYLYQCKSMEYLFPFSVATCCHNLEELRIKHCGNMKEIVSEKRESTSRTDHIFEFNQLNFILLWSLNKLEGFYPGNHILACPSLRTIDVSKCEKLNLYKTLSTSSLKRYPEEKLSVSLQQPLFIVEEVIPNLKKMRIDHKDAKMILQSQDLGSLFTKLTFLGLSDYKNEEATFPYWFLQNVPSLECLVVECSSFKKIFEDERLVSIKIHTRIKKLTLSQLPELQHLCEEVSQTHLVLEVLKALEHLDIAYCRSMTYLFSSSVTFSHLKYLRIRRCNKLINLITSSTAQSLVKLTVMRVEECDLLEEIITGKENAEIAFVSLEILILNNLPSLNSFSSSKCFLKFPLLEEVVVSKCARMKIFSEGNTSTPSLRKVRIEENDEEWNWKGNLNDTVQKMFEDKVAFSKFKILSLSKYPELKDSWYSELHPNMFCNLKSLVVQGCDFLSHVLFPSNVLQVLHVLERLEVRDCNSLEALFDVNELKSKEKLSTQLKDLILSNIPKLKKIWNEDPHEIISYGNLRRVDIYMCQNLLYIFPLSLCQDLGHLEILCVNSSGVEQIVAMEQTSTENIITFPRLNDLMLYHLKHLRCFYPRKHTLECRSLKILNVHHCDALNMFSFNHFNIQQHENHNHDDIPIRQALFSIEKLSPNLEHLTINRVDAMTILRCYSQENFLSQKVEFLRLQYFDETPTSFLNDFCAILPNLASLQVRNSSFETLFPTTGTNNDDLSTQILQQIRNLWLFELEKLKYIWQEDFPSKHSLLQDLETLRVIDCPSLISLVPSTSFKSLTSLLVTNCKELGYLITSSTAKSLVKLTELKIENCDKLLDVVKIDEENIDEPISFESLEKLELTSLSSLRSFCNGKHNFVFPSLIRFVAKECHQMKIFSSGVTVAPYLTLVEVESEKMRWKVDLNTTIQQLFMEKVKIDEKETKDVEGIN